MVFCLGYIIRDRYKVKGILGSGGFAVTYLIEDLELPDKPLFVLKEITPSPNLSHRQNEVLFQREAKALYRLGKHPQIPQLFASFQEKDRFYLVQEYICGQTLEAELKEKKTFTVTEVIELLQEILAILQVVHQEEYIHRDIKPTNLIRRQEDNKIVLIDFGAVKEISKTEYTVSGEYKTTFPIGTRPYMPAEQYAGNPRYNSDIYALGITAIRLITGLKPPISSEDLGDKNNRMQFDRNNGEIIWKATPPLNKKLKIEPKLEVIFNKMVRFSFCDRYQTVTDILADLAQFNSPDSSVIFNGSLSNNQKQNKLGFKFIAVGLCGLITGISLSKIIPWFTAPKSTDYPIDFAEVCNDPIVKGEEFQQYQGSPQYLVLKSAVPIWSVFSWKCVFSYQNDTQIKGIELDKYCSEKYSNDNYIYEAYFKNYLDKNSWYCTNVGTKLEYEVSSSEFISSGEQTSNSHLPLQTEATKLFARQEYTEAIDKFLESWQEESKDPQTLIYLNNALLELSGKEYYTIAIVVPLTSNRKEDVGVKNIDLGNEMLRGVAQAQTEVNLGLDLNNQLPGKEYLKPKSIAGKGIKIIIADDANKPQQAKKIAEKLIAQKEVIGVIGNYASDATRETIDLFNDSQTTLISPGSTSEELTQPHRQFFFRTTPTVSDIGEKLANYLINEQKLKQATIFYNPDSPYTRSLRKEFKQVFEDKGGSITSEYDNFHLDSFNATEALKKIGEKKNMAIVLFPDGQVTDATNNSLKIVEQNRGKNWIVGGATLYNPQTLKIAQIQALEKVVVAVPWHLLSSPNLEFTIHSKQLWSGEVNYRTALAYDAARTFIHALTILSDQFQPITRINLQKTIADPNFSTQGAIGTIRFASDGNRRNPFMELVKVIECKTANNNNKVNFVPLNSNECPEQKKSF
jgi:ABC-type branched-subunit amino acid transport system substrate-binding protein/serine/threonine protein kinase